MICVRTVHTKFGNIGNYILGDICCIVLLLPVVFYQYVLLPHGGVSIVKSYYFVSYMWPKQTLPVPKGLYLFSTINV